MRNYFFLLLPILFIAASCNPDAATDDDAPETNFDRQEMLAGWVDNVIVPGYTDLETDLEALLLAVDGFDTSPSEASFAAVLPAFRTAYLSYQRISPFMISKAEEIRLREQLNTYPANTDLIEANSRTGANLALPSNTAAQGFPALDYLLHGLEEDTIISGEDAADYRAYLHNVTTRMLTLTRDAADEWNDTNRTAFIENDGNSATASIDRTVNDYIFYYEKFLRAGKVGIPAGIFSDDPLADRAEALHSGLSPELFDEALDASVDFFLNHGLADYLDALNVTRDGEKLSTTIANQFSNAKARRALIDVAFAEQVETDNTKMLELYNELQRNVILMKVDMLQALSINVDYVDADGD